MSKTILLIENDAAFAEEMSGALEAMGLQVRVTGDGKDGLDLAKELRPDAIVLCVELPKLSGYSICNKIKKDEALKGIPLILTSSEATEEVFEDHKKLKVRAEEYLVKPYVSAALLEKLTGLIGLPVGAAEGELAATGHEPAGEEEVVSLEEELGLEAFAAEPEENLPALDLDSLPDEPAAAGTGGGVLDDDLRLLDDAFDGLSMPPSAPSAPLAAAPSPGSGARPAPVPESELQAADEAIEKALGVDRPVTSEDLDAASASLPEEDESVARADLGGLSDEADLALGALTEAPNETTPSTFDALDAFDALGEPAAPVPSPTPASRSPGIAAEPAALEVAAIGAASVIGVAALASGAAAVIGSAPTAAGLAELARLEAELAEVRAAVSAREADALELGGKLETAVLRSERAESELGKQEAEVAALKARGDALAGQVKKADTEAKAAREESRRSAEQARDAGARADAAEARVTAAEAKAMAAETRSLAAEQEAAGQRSAAEKAAAALAVKAAELATAQAAASQLATVEREVERLETELLVARGEVDGARSEVEKRSAELKRRITELEAANSKNEERVVKAYLKIKGDEKVRDKARKALSIALQLLEEGLPPDAPGERRPAPPVATRPAE